MLLILLCLHAFSRVASQAPPPPPQNVQVEKGQLTWTPGEPDVTYTVNYRRFNSDKWEALPACIQTPLHSCNISAIGPSDTNDSPENSCVTLRVQAERRGLRSEGVNACSRYGDVCTPPFSILPQPGSLTVHLSENHELAKEHAENAKHRIYFGREGESPLQFSIWLISVSLRYLDPTEVTQVVPPGYSFSQLSFKDMEEIPGDRQLL